MERNVVILLVLCALTTVSAESASATDLRRATSKIPGDLVKGAGHADMVFKLNEQFQRNFKVMPCENFTVVELIDLQRELHRHRDPELDAIYQSTMDSRRLGGFGRVADDLDELKALWQEEVAILKQYPKLHDMSRDAKCHEAVMWMVHHIPDEAKADLKAQHIMPLLPVRKAPRQEEDLAGAAPQEVARRVYESYSVGIGCSSCHASGQVAKNTESTLWPDEVIYTATGHGAYPFWDNGGPGCSSCDPSVDNSARLKVKWSSKLNSENLMHESCGDMSWTGSSHAPNKSPCNHLFTPDEGAFIYSPTAALSEEADGKFCCRSALAGSSDFPGAVPKDWMRSMNYFGTKGTYKGDHYTGDIKIYWSANQGLDFWYYETPEGKPVDQGEGCYFPSAKTNYQKRACAKMLPIVLWHEFDQFNETTYSKDDFRVPDVCKSTTVQCLMPGEGAPPDGGSKLDSVIV